MNNKLELNLVDKLVLLALDDEKGNFVSDPMVFGYCLAGAVLFELSVKEKIQIVENKVMLTNNAIMNDEVLDYCLGIINDSRKDKKVNHWLGSIGQKESKLRKMVLAKLISMGILEEKENKVLWVFTTKKYPTVNEVPENIIRKRMNDIVVNGQKAEMDEIMIISLADSCGLNREVYGKEIAKRNAKEIKNIIKEYQFADTTGKLIQEIHDTIIAAIVVLITTTAVTTTVTS